MENRVDRLGKPVHVGRTRSAAGARSRRAGRGKADTQTKEGIARDLLNEIDAHKFQIVVMGKKSFRERKPFLMGSHASKILQNTKGVILCLVS